VKFFKLVSEGCQTLIVVIFFKQNKEGGA